MEWIQTISEYGALGIITLIAFLFATGKIISSATMKDMKQSFEKQIGDMQKSYESQIEDITQSYCKQTELMTSSFNRQVETLKNVIEIMKRQNGIK